MGFARRKGIEKNVNPPFKDAILGNIKDQGLSGAIQGG